MDVLTLENLGHLGVLIFLQAVLGFDNLLYISLESQKAPVEAQAKVRKMGISIAIVLRIVLLFVMIKLIDALKEPLVEFHWEGILTGGLNFSSIVFLFGGAFIMYTAVKEISHMLTIHHLSGEAGENKETKTAGQVVAMIVFMNLIFSFDSILSALAITNVFLVLATAIVISGIAMMVMADAVSVFLEKNRKYEVLGMFILLIVGVVLLGEAGVAAAHAQEPHNHELVLSFFGHEVEPMSKSTFYFSIAVLVVVDIIQSKYQKKLDAERTQGKTQEVSTS